MPKTKIKLISWNVNGIRAIQKKDFLESFQAMAPDILAVQETKIQEHQLAPPFSQIEGYDAFWSFATVKKGYSGVGVYSKIPPLDVKHGIGLPHFDDEGRILELTFKEFIFYNIYFPNGQMNEERLQYKLDFYRDFFAYVDTHKKNGKHIIIAGDFNTAHQEIDIKNPKSNEKRSGFLRIERDVLDDLKARGYVDTFRFFNPDTVKYTWWSYRFQARAKNVGWRIDYFWASQSIIDKGWITATFIDNAILGSDHCPLGLVLEI